MEAERQQHVAVVGDVLLPFLNPRRRSIGRGEGGGYAQHTTADGYPGTPPKKVLLHVALGDTVESKDLLVRLRS